MPSAMLFPYDNEIQTFRCPVCKRVERAEYAHRSVYAEHTMSYCSFNCMHIGKGGQCAPQTKKIAQ